MTCTDFVCDRNPVFEFISLMLCVEFLMFEDFLLLYRSSMVDIAFPLEAAWIGDASREALRFLISLLKSWLRTDAFRSRVDVVSRPLS